MSIYKEANRRKLRFNTSQGSVSVERLWELSIEELDTLGVAAQTETDNSTKKSLLKKKTSVDEIAQLKYEIIKDVFFTKAEEREAANDAADKKAHNEKILSLIEKQRNSKLENLSEEELLKMIK